MIASKAGGKHRINEGIDHYFAIENHSQQFLTMTHQMTVSKLMNGCLSRRKDSIEVRGPWLPNSSHPGNKRQLNKFSPELILVMLYLAASEVTMLSVSLALSDDERTYFVLITK